MWTRTATAAVWHAVICTKVCAVQQCIAVAVVEHSIYRMIVCLVVHYHISCSVSSYLRIFVRLPCCYMLVIAVCGCVRPFLPFIQYTCASTRTYIRKQASRYSSSTAVELTLAGSTRVLSLHTTATSKGYAKSRKLASKQKHGRTPVLL